MENLSVGRCFGGWLVGGRPVNGSVVSGSLEVLSVAWISDRLLVVGGLSVVGGFVTHLSKHAKISEFFTSEERSSGNFGKFLEEQQPSTSSQNQTETTTEPKQSSSDGHNSDITSTNEVRVNYIFTFFFIHFGT